MVDTEATFFSDLQTLGIRSRKFERNLSYDELFILETENDADLTPNGAVAVGIGAARGPVPRFVVREGETERGINWEGSAHHAMRPETWARLKDIALTQLNGRALYIMDLFCGAHAASRIGVRIITELPWKAHFAKNMFVRPTAEELKNFQADWIVLDAALASPDPEEFGIATGALVASHFAEHMTVIAGTSNDEEMKQALFSVMHYLLPNKGIGIYRCSANQGISRGDCALFFGVMGSGKSTLAIDPKRLLIGDDEHGWDNEGIFNLEGGYLTKENGLPPSTAPLLRKDALLEEDELGEHKISLPLSHLQRIVRPSRGGHPETIFFLTSDSFGVLPPLAKLSLGQAQYHFLSGYSSKGPSAEPGFSACFDEASLLIDPLRHAEILMRRARDHGTQFFLVNVMGMSLSLTRYLIDFVLSGGWDDERTETLPLFQLRIMPKIPAVLEEILNPRLAAEDPEKFDQDLLKLGRLFADNFERFTGSPVGRHIAMDFGPHIS